MSLSWITPGADVFYNRASTGDRVPAIVLGSSPQPGDFLRIQYEVGGKVVVHQAAALHRIEFQIRSPSPSPPISPSQRHEDPPGSNKYPPARQKETPGIIQRPLATIHKHLGTPAKVVCGGPLHRVKSPETSGAAPCVHRATTPSRSCSIDTDPR
mmetsp:Transcript_79611/g.132944  ORF Transcript_79611/g.132944 Transcript_79611/m.132944 type:complete len:155 (+) Transcript_79611:335-799(+)